MAQNRIAKYLTDTLINLRDIPQYVRSVSEIGIDFSTIAGKNRKLLGVGESEQDEMYNIFIPKDIDYDNIPYFNKKYKEKVKELKKLSSYTEIEDILDKICDEAIVYDKYGKFCEIDVSSLSIKEEVKEDIKDNFNRIYSLLGWGDGISAWEKFREWSTTGYLSYEIIFEYEQKSEVEKRIKELENKNKVLNEQLKLANSNFRKIYEGVAEKNINKKERAGKKSHIKRLENNIEHIGNERIKKEGMIAIYEDMFKVPENGKLGLNKKENGVEDGQIPIRIKGFQEIEPETLIPIRVKIDDDKFITIWKKKTAQDMFPIMLSYL